MRIFYERNGNYDDLAQCESRYFRKKGARFIQSVTVKCVPEDPGKMSLRNAHLAPQNYYPHSRHDCLGTEGYECCCFRKEAPAFGGGVEIFVAGTGSSMKVRVRPTIVIAIAGRSAVGSPQSPSSLLAAYERERNRVAQSSTIANTLRCRVFHIARCFLFCFGRELHTTITYIYGARLQPPRQPADSPTLSLFCFFLSLSTVAGTDTWNRRRRTHR